MTVDPGTQVSAPDDGPSESTAVWTQGTIDLHGDAIYYEVATPTEPIGTIVLCHGAGGHHASWFRQVPVLSRRYRVVTWDQRGFGRSTNRRRLASPTTAAADLERLLEHLGVGADVHLVGQSLGGWAVLRFAIRNPGHADSLIFSSSVGGLLSPAVRTTFEQYLQAAAADNAPKFVTSTSALGNPFKAREPDLAWLYQQLGTCAADAPSNAVPLMLTDINDLRDAATVRAHTLFLVGELDPIFPPPSVTEAAGFIHGARVKIIPGAGHSPYYEAPETWNRLVQDFVDAVRSPRP